MKDLYHVNLPYSHVYSVYSILLPDDDQRKRGIRNRSIQVLVAATIPF